MSLAEPGAVVTGDAAYEQSLRTILRTPLGSVAGDPGFGIELDGIVDGPANLVRPRLVRAVIQAVAASDPRIIVIGVVPGPVRADGKLTVTVRWKPTNDTRDRVRSTTVEVT